MIWKVPQIWKGGDAWILGGGPSLSKQFKIPDVVVRSVLEGSSKPSVFSPYMELIHDKHVIGVNVAFLFGEWVDVAFFGDGGFFLKYGEVLSQFPGLKVSLSPKVQPCNWFKYIPRDNTRPFGLTLNRAKISWNENSGSAAINLAVHFGAKRIFLLGFDMRLDEQGKQHWHSLYRTLAEQSKKLKKHTPPFARHLVGFKAIKRDAEDLGVQIYNVNPDSRIQEFPKVTLEEALLL
jgi:hypothetical protein